MGMIIGRSHLPFNGSRDIPSGGVSRTYSVTTTRARKCECPWGQLGRLPPSSESREA
jgi:hypothetical protein